MAIYLLSPTPVPGAISLPMIQFHFLQPSIDFGRYNYLIFTSKNGVAAAQRIDPAWRQVPALVIGEGTAKAVERGGGIVAYVAQEAYGERFAQEIVSNFPRGGSYLYLRPRRVLFDLAAALAREGLMVEEQIVYETRCNPDPSLQAPPPGSTIIFSSPSTIKCFLKRFGWRQDYRAVAIGRKTASHFPYPIAISPTQSLQGAVAFAKELEF
ncbi:MAG: uroporphyrinogen-III synthase [Nitratiruptor sp.]|nr:uroporphyrinogen-III synthase [Nitratiruptor sp.]NPA83397.1 uroporphyrinogen-III synthase [Campylobacterota bacterium]